MQTKKEQIEFKNREYVGSPQSLLHEVYIATSKAAEKICLNGGAFASPEPTGQKIKEEENK